MHLGMAEFTYHIRVTVTLTLTSELVVRIIVSGAHLFFFSGGGGGVGILHLVCKCILDGNSVRECILEWWIGLFHFPVTVT